LQAGGVGVLLFALVMTSLVLGTVVVVLSVRLRKVNSSVRQMDAVIDGVTGALRRAEEDQLFTYRCENPHLTPCWQARQCGREDCPAHDNPDLRCWLLPGKLCHDREEQNLFNRVRQCETCEVYKHAQPDVVWRLSEQLNTIMALLEQNSKRLAESQRQVEQAGKLASLGEFAGGIAHELNNPLDGIMSCLLRLERDPANLTQNLEYLKLMREALERMATAVQHILAYSRKRDTQLKPIDVHVVLQDIVALIKVSARHNAIDVRLEFDDDIPLIMADRYYLGEAFLNLAVNSMAATPEGGTLTFRTGNTKGEDGLNGFVEVDVIDTGAGIEPKDLPKIFEPFFTTKELGKGTGLGLAIVKHIIEEHRGKISFESAPQAGTTVRVLLPLAEENE
jgi:signal transduction histidine kinase